MNVPTPICDFVRNYIDSHMHRLHMPGHKGASVLGVEALDITEIDGADTLYHADGIIAQSERIAGSLFGTGRTLYAAEGSSLSIRAMLYLALLDAKKSGRSRTILAGRNAHKVFMTAAALLDFDIQWLYSAQTASLIACEITPAQLDTALSTMPSPPAAVYITSPDYLGNIADIRGLAQVCHRYSTPLLVDNAHGAYTHFLQTPVHPMDLGADLCCDSAHKTLPVLTGGAYLHIAQNASAVFYENADAAMALFSSTSPSYLILQSLDAANRILSDGYREALADCVFSIQSLRERLCSHGYVLVGDEPLKLTVAPKSFGYTGDMLASILIGNNLIPEFHDPDHLVLMLTPQTTDETRSHLESVLLSVRRREAIDQPPPCPARPRRVCSPREAMLTPGTRLPIEQCVGRVLAQATVSCPPAIPVVVCGEEIDAHAAEIFRYYDIKTCTVI